MNDYDDYDDFEEPLARRPEPQGMTSQDIEHLRLLSILHYVLAAMIGCGSLLPIFHVVIGVSLISGGHWEERANGDPIAVGWIFVVMGSLAILCGLMLAGSIAMAGNALRKRTRHTFCIVVAGLSCLFMPLGTVLGVFTIIVLSRESVRSSFR